MQACVAAATLLLGVSWYVLLCQAWSILLHHAYIECTRVLVFLVAVAVGTCGNTGLESLETEAKCGWCLGACSLSAHLFKTSAGVLACSDAVWLCALCLAACSACCVQLSSPKLHAEGRNSALHVLQLQLAGMAMAAARNRPGQLQSGLQSKVVEFLQIVFVGCCRRSHGGTQVHARPLPQVLTH